ncbi:MAG: response regulator transcription factor [Alphaproteobacteria bacterium]|nr:response regulator transcription factor [Alphaproteobacteria bacterium]MBU1512761.1 response regulator transcription factor [Alphaproteobacteria bacterium]MBU2096140.1 response regulator transcription factor [Alphaproteobacteria bacterium]MBU2152828.1 response regulator transcription factor [Alphaproteobacteria bacterium]MBU2307970.1 response regulator transcription factor [Alphaproteobacteria bacterium]
MHILLVEDNEATAKSVKLILGAEGHNVSMTASGEEAVELAEIYEYDAILMDLDLEDITGVEALRELRLKKNTTPVIILSGTTDVETKVSSLAAGADDYMTKPFHKSELGARINAVVRRSRGHVDSIIRTGAIALNLNTRTVEVSDIQIHLTPSEYKMLELLSLRKNTVLTKEACLNHLYNGITEPEIKIIDVFICKLRKKIAAVDGGGSPIETVWGGGYMLRDAKSVRLAA